MIKCSSDCTPLCDFCIYFAHSGIDESGARRPYSGIVDGSYEGYCEKHRREQSLEGDCDDFHCFRAKGE